jgi:alpha-D-xyloside xylohydrolase
MLYSEGDTLVFRFDDHQLRIQPWGQNSLRVRATKRANFEQQDWALLEPEKTSPKITISDDDGARIENGRIHATVSRLGKMIIYNDKGDKLLEEYARHRRDLKDPKCSSLEVEARELRPILGGDYRLTMRFESLDPNEQIFGMGQYQHPHLDLKGSDIEMAHRNSQASVPFALSSLGYGFLWNNPAVGRAVLGKNIMSFEAYSTKELDYWVTAGETPAEIIQAYAKSTGYVPMMPEYGLGFWQCKLRYWNQEQLLEVAREYRRRELPIDLIVIDFFHWKNQGDWSFDNEFFPDPGMLHRTTLRSITSLTISYRGNDEGTERPQD